MSWNPKALSDSFRSRADFAERYADELARRKNKGETERDLHDEHLAIFYVNDFLVERSFLDSREELVAALREYVKRGPVSFSTAIDPERFRAHWERVANNLIKEIGKEAA